MKKKRIINVIFISLICLAVITGIYFLYIKKIIVIPCVFHELTGLYCPGCGMTRALASLANLEIYQAIRYNALIIFLVPAFLLYIVFKIKSYINNEKNKFNIPNYLLWSALIITILYGILRNIPLFDFLKPTIVL